jgi:GABA permease
VTIAAAESDAAEKQISKATNSVIWRITLFYILSIFIVVALVPWTDSRLAADGSYVTVLEVLGVPHAKALIDVVVLTSVTSCLNSSLYTASRMLFSLSSRGDAPACARITSNAGTPVVAVLLSTAAAFATVIANYLVPAQVFGFLMASSGAIALLVYLVIAVSQLRMRGKLLKQGHQLTLKMWFFPWRTWAVILFISATLVIMLIRPDHRMEVVATALLTIVVVCSGLLVSQRRKAQGAAGYAADAA